ncbi:hypothetical protein [Bacillus sp. AFS023182]|nr:hypothetical protein [Bacillus sp. AFS023182]
MLPIFTCAVQRVPDADPGYLLAATGSGACHRIIAFCPSASVN